MNSSTYISETGEGEAIVFVHGNASTREIWNEVIPQLGKSYRCISYDLRGHGDGPAISEPLTIDLLVEDLDEVCRQCGESRIALVGHSLGAFVAARYAHRFPERVRWLSLIAMPANRADADRSAADEFLKKLEDGGTAGALSQMVKLWYTSAFVAAHPGYLDKRLEQLDRIDDGVFLEFYRVYSRNDVDDLLPDLICPTQVMTGQFARGADANVADYIVGKLPNSEIKVFQELKNGLLTEVPDQVGSAILSFAQRVRCAN